MCFGPMAFGADRAKRAAIALVAAFAALTLAPVARTAPLPEELHQSLIDLARQFDAAVRAGRVGEAAELCTDEMKKTLWETARDLARAREMRRRELLRRMPAQLLDSYAVAHAAQSRDRRLVRMVFVGPSGGVGEREIDTNFIHEGNSWKISQWLAGPDPARIQRSPDSRPEPKSAYMDSASTTLDGRIVRVDFAATHTLIVVRVMDEEQLLFAPPKTDLQRGGLDIALLRPWATIEAKGLPHRSNKLKTWVTDLRLTVED